MLYQGVSYALTARAELLTILSANIEKKECFFNTVWTSVGSLLFALIALIIPAIGIIRKGAASQKKIGSYIALSLGACGVSLCMQICYAAIMVRLEDWSGLMDTMSTAAFVSAGLLVITILLNLFFISSCKTQTR